MDSLLREAYESDTPRPERTEDPSTFRMPSVIKKHAGYSLLAKAMAIYKTRWWERSLKVLRDAVARYDKCAFTYYYMGITQLKAEKPVEERINSYRKCIQLHPQFADARYNLGCILHQQNDIEAAEAEYLAAIQASSNHSDAHLNLALLYKAKGEDGQPHYRRALDTADEPEIQVEQPPVPPSRRRSRTSFDDQPTFPRKLSQTTLQQPQHLQQKDVVEQEIDTTTTQPQPKPPSKRSTRGSLGQRPIVNARPQSAKPKDTVANTKEPPASSEATTATRIERPIAESTEKRRQTTAPPSDDKSEIDSRNQEDKNRVLQQCQQAEKPPAGTTKLPSLPKDSKKTKYKSMDERPSARSVRVSFSHCAVQNVKQTSAAAKVHVEDESQAFKSMRLAVKEGKGETNEYEAAVLRNPKSAEARVKYGSWLLTIRGDCDAAEREYRAASSIDPAFAEARYNLAVLLDTVRNDYDQAEIEYKKAIEIDPKHSGARNNYAVLLEQTRQDFAAAADQYKAALATNPNDADIRANYEACLLKRRPKSR